MTTNLLFSGWIRRRGKDWKLVIRAVDKQAAHLLLEQHKAPDTATRLVLPAGEHPLQPESRRRNAC